MSDDVNDIRELKVSKITLGFIASILFVGGTIAWTAAGTANRISNLEDTVMVIESNKTFADQAVLQRLESLEKAIENAPTPDNSRIEEKLEDIESEIDDWNNWREEDLQWQLNDLWWRTDVIERACRTKVWCDDILRKEFQN